jgi:hypothetical protein
MPADERDRSIHTGSNSNFAFRRKEVVGRVRRARAAMRE